MAPSNIRVDRREARSCDIAGDGVEGVRDGARAPTRTAPQAHPRRIQLIAAAAGGQTRTELAPDESAATPTPARRALADRGQRLGRKLPSVPLAAPEQARTRPSPRTTPPADRAVPFRHRRERIVTRMRGDRLRAPGATRGRD